jgi:hypothetical protein
MVAIGSASAERARMLGLGPVVTCERPNDAGVLEAIESLLARREAP